ncbi:MAG: peptide chain release factor-like protein [Phycisphaerales bacterium]
MAGPHPAGLDDPALGRQCEVTFGRGSGPGGQHRNKVETAVRIVHVPTGIEVTATERRSQSQNRHVAEHRLRVKLAMVVRTRLDTRQYRPSTLWSQRRQGRAMPVNAKNKDFPALLAEALDVVAARKFDVGGAAGLLGVSMSQLAKLLGREPKAMAWVNDGRVKLGLPKLR